MRIEHRAFRDASFLLLIAEGEEESRLLDMAGKPGDRVEGELSLSNEYGKWYLRLPAIHGPPPPAGYKRKPAGSGKPITVEPYADDVPLHGDDAPRPVTIDELLRYAATIRARFGNTCVLTSLKWGSAAIPPSPEHEGEHNGRSDAP